MPCVIKWLVRSSFCGLWLIITLFILHSLLTFYHPTGQRWHHKNCYTSSIIKVVGSISPADSGLNTTQSNLKKEKMTSCDASWYKMISQKQFLGTLTNHTSITIIQAHKKIKISPTDLLQLWKCYKISDLCKNLHKKYLIYWGDPNILIRMFPVL